MAEEKQSGVAAVADVMREGVKTCHAFTPSHNTQYASRQVQ